MQNVLQKSKAQPRTIAVLFALVVSIALWTAIHMGLRTAHAEEDHAAAQRAFLNEAARQQLPTLLTGQVIHMSMHEYRRQAPDSAGGPPHLDPRWLTPDTTIREVWAVIDERGTVASASNYLRDEFGTLLGQSAVNEQGSMTVFEARRGTTTTVTFQLRAPSAEVGDVGIVLKEPFRYAAQPIRQGQYGGGDAIILEQRGPADPEWLALVVDGRVAQPYARDLEIKEVGRRLIFDQTSRRLLHASEFVTLMSGGEQVLRSQEWKLVEILDQAQVPPLALTPVQPALRNEFSPVPTRQLTVSQAPEILPFALYVLPSPDGDIGTIPVTYTLGQRLAPWTAPQ